LGFPRVVRPFSAGTRGFALIITLSLMVLLTILSVGLLSLSTISLRAGGRDDLGARARANARMALMLAIGELQHQAGPDTRVTARADILDAQNPPLLGVWKSWEGTDHDSNGRPTSPGDYDSKKEARFLKWMVSGDNEQIPNTKEGKNTVALVGANTIGSSGGSDMQVHLEPVRISDGGGDGGMAWWIGGENQKARLPKPFILEDNSPAQWSAIAKSHTVVNPDVFRMERLMKDATDANKTFSLASGDFVGEAGDQPVSKEFFYDLSTSSVGLLTNTATGGWRKDLSLVTENWSAIGNSNLPFFRRTPEADIMFTKPSSGNPTPAKAMIYPWSNYRSTTLIPIYRQGAVSSWENLKDYATLYRTKMSTSASGRNRISTFSTDINGDSFNFIHKVRLLPVVARVQWVFSYSAAAAIAPVGALEPRLLLSPVITMWNPYNVELQMTAAGGGAALSFTLDKPLPAALNYTIGGIGGQYKSIFTGANNYPSFTPPPAEVRALTYNIASAFTLKPGETRVFSAQNALAVPAGSPLPLAAGYRAKGGHYMNLLPPKADGSVQSVAGNSKIKADAKFDVEYNDISNGVGIFLNMNVGTTGTHLAYRMTYTKEVAAAVYQALPNLAEVPLNSTVATPVPFLSTMFGARMASDTHIPAKGFLQSSPLVNYTAMGNKDTIEVSIMRHYLGTRHPVNSPFDFSFVEHTSAGDDHLPNEDPTTQRGYIVSGFLKSNGLSRCVIAEIPTRPMQSLCELQNWDLRYENPVPPFAFNIIGNSDATPLVPANAVVDPSNGGSAMVGVNLQHDDSYCANHVLFDDWFFSSIAPNPTAYGTAGKSMQQSYTDLVSGVAPLGNRAYQAIAEDAAYAQGNSSNATELYNDRVKVSAGWKTVASRLEVEGMFNVNSTSVTAWRALLGHARNQSVPYIEEDAGGSWKVAASGEVDHPVSRFAISGDAQAGKSGSSGSFPGATQFTGYQVLDEKLIDALAEEIVDQVRARGPFLSLSEFVNRQLSSGELALAGAVQAALNEIAKKSGSPYSFLQGASKNSSGSPLRPGDAEYRFPAAGEGESAFGLPGWIRQADVLRPIAPILSARDDTFTIRAHGDARDENGNIVSRAVCEAVVRRTRNYVDPQDAADLATVPTSTLNKTFGRRMEIVSFRWLNGSEI